MKGDMKMEDKTTKTKVDEIKTTAKKKAAEIKKETVKKAKAAKQEAVKIAENTTESTIELAKTAKKGAAKIAESTAESTVEIAKTAKKAAARVRKPTTKIFLQYYGKEISQEELSNRVLEQFKEMYEDVHAKKLEIYLKPEDNAAYYVINSEYTGKIDL